MLFSRASCATLTPGCIDCSTMAILKSRGSWGVVVVCGRQGFHREQGRREERTIFGMPVGKGAYPEFWR